jgi:hypothetical protein
MTADFVSGPLNPPLETRIDVLAMQFAEYGLDGVEMARHCHEELDDPDMELPRRVMGWLVE